MDKSGFIMRFSRLGDGLRKWLRGEGGMPGLDEAVAMGASENKFFTPYMQRAALHSIAEGFLRREVLERWCASLPPSKATESSEAPVCGIVAAGNIPAVAFHDIFCTLASGWKPLVKLSSKDRYLLPLLFPDVDFCRDTEGWKVDALLSMGSDGAAEHFRRQFPDVPKVLRASRFSCALLEGNETPEQLSSLAEDMLLYYGLGCRSVTCLLVPAGYDFEPLADAAGEFARQHCGSILKDNYRKNKAVMTLAGERFIDGTAVIFADARSIVPGAAEDMSRCVLSGHPLPVGAVWFAEYSCAEEIDEFMAANNSRIQKIFRNFGSAQQPYPDDYPDGVDIPLFLARIANTTL